MKIYYVDEYGESIFEQEDPNVPVIGDTVSFDDEDWKVKSRNFFPKNKSVVIELTQNQVRSKETDEVGGRLAEMQRAIVEVNKRQDQQDKKSRLLREQMVSVRTYLRTQQK